MKRVLFFGASVTAQYRNHHSGEITGYVAYLEQLSWNDYIVSSISFPSSQYSNMGVLGFASLLTQQADIIFFEWHTTGENSLCVATLIEQFELLEHLGIRMILLVLPSRRFQDADQLQKFKILRDTSIPVLDLRHLLEENPHVNILRDDVHTTLDGARLYAEAIDYYIKENLLCETPIASSTLKPFSFKDLPTRYRALLYREVPLGFDLKAGEHIALLSDADSRIIFTITRGPQCPVLHVSDIDSSQHVDLIDQWSYYDRSSNAIDFKITGKQELLIQALSQLPSYAERCPKLLEEEYSHLRPTDPSTLKVALQGFYVGLDCLVSIRKS